MKKHTRLALLMLFFLLLISCDQTVAEPTIRGEMIQPGDKIGEMDITAIDLFQGDNHLGLYCSDIPNQLDPNTYEVECEANPGDRIQVDCLGWRADSAEELDALWETSTWQMTIDDQIIDLPEFGAVEIFNSDISKLTRFWNVLIEEIAPGTHTIVCDEIVEDDGQYVTHYIFTVPDQAKTYPTLPTEPVAGQHPYTSESSQLNLLLYFPDEYGKDPQKEWPLILYLHGSDMRGSSLDRLKEGSLPDILESRKDLPFIVASPQLSGRSGEEFWRMEDPTKAVLALLDEIQTEYAVDSKRVYFTGVSNGGGGVWEIGLAYPKRFAALVPVMGYYGWPYEVPENICDLKDVPVWAFHGAEDETIALDVEQYLVDALQACGGDVQFTIYPGRGHDIQNLPYADVELYNWLLSQRLE